jgi:hypothetical protein
VDGGIMPRGHAIGKAGFSVTHDPCDSLHKLVSTEYAMFSILKDVSDP